MILKKKSGLVLAATLALVFAAPNAAQAASTDLSPVDDTTANSEVSSLIANDPDMTYVSVTEAEEQFGFDPEAESVEPVTGIEPEITPLWSWWGCDWHGQADYPHVTNGEASVHGYWVRDGGDCPSTGTVTVELQALGCTSLGCTWITQETDTVSGVTPGSGTGHWATPHAHCATVNPVGWRGRVDTALTDFYDPFGWDDGPERDLNCTPA